MSGKRLFCYASYGREHKADAISKHTNTWDNLDTALKQAFSTCEKSITKRNRSKSPAKSKKKSTKKAVKAKTKTKKTVVKNPEPSSEPKKVRRKSAYGLFAQQCRKRAKQNSEPLLNGPSLKELWKSQSAETRDLFFVLARETNKYT